MMLRKILVDYRNQHGISVREAAKVIGISAAALSRWENGRPISADNWKKILLWLMSDQPRA